MLPTTTIGSFPQTDEVRAARADLRAGRIDTAGYEERIRAEIGEVVSFQEKAGLDVLVHGEPERNDMVQYFAEQLTGYLATRHGWVQSYGTRYVRPPALEGDISRPAPMTVRWTAYAQSLTARPVKGMLTGPVTMLAWSFVRDDQPLGETARQVALALRAEVTDLEAGGTPVIQVDEPTLRETLPLRSADRAAYAGTSSWHPGPTGPAPPAPLPPARLSSDVGGPGAERDDPGRKARLPRRFRATRGRDMATSPRGIATGRHRPVTFPTMPDPQHVPQSPQSRACRLSR